MIQVAKCPACGAPLEIDGDRLELCEFCGSRMVVSAQNTFNSMSFGFDSLLVQAQKLKEVLHLARAGRKIEAIKIYRETFNVGLAEAKEAVENLAGGKPVNAMYMRSFTTSTTHNADGSNLSEIRAEIARGNKINAIKLYREKFGVGLAEAKAAVERLETHKLGRQNTLNFDNQAVAKTAKTVGALTVIAILLAVLGGIAGIGIAIFSVIKATEDSLPVPTPITLAPNHPGTQKNSFAVESIRAGGEGIGAGYFKDNRTIAVDGAGRIYSADYSGNLIQQFDADGKFISQWQLPDERVIFDLLADRKNRVYVLSASHLEIYDAAAQTLLSASSRPAYRTIALDANGKLYAITDKNEFARLNENGKIIEKTSPLAAQFNFKIGTLRHLAMDARGNFFAFEPVKKEILKFSPDAKFLLRFNTLPDKNKQISYPYDIAVDGKGRVFVTEISDVYVFDNDGRYLDSFATRQTMGLAFDDKNALWTASRPYIVKYVFNE